MNYTPQRTRSDVTIGVLGPAWADTSGRMEVVRNPLRVQNHVTRMVGALVPGVIATTTQACYYGLHPLVASVAHERGLDLDEVWTLIRRVEVALAWVSMHHDQHLVDIPEAHGESEIRSHVTEGTLNLEVASRPGNYAVAKAGFAGGAYFNSEFELGLLERTWTPGPRFDPHALRVTRGRLAPLFELASHDLVAAADAEELAGDICVCTARNGEEGQWLRDLIWGRLGGERWSKPDASRRRDGDPLGEGDRSRERTRSKRHRGNAVRRDLRRSSRIVRDRARARPPSGSMARRVLTPLPGDRLARTVGRHRRPLQWLVHGRSPRRNRLSG